MHILHMLYILDIKYISDRVVTHLLKEKEHISGES